MVDTAWLPRRSGRPGVRRGGGPGPRDVEEALHAALLAKPIGEWVSFLHLAQARLVRRTFSGLARIRGAAGMGKTVVGLHRAAHLARSRPGRVLVTAYVRTLPDVLRELLNRLAPDVVDRVELAGTHPVGVRTEDLEGAELKISRSLS